MLNKDQILKANDLPIEEMEVKEWGGTIGIRCLTGAERGQLEIQSKTYTNAEGNLCKPNWRAFMCSYCIVDKEGKRLFLEDDVEALAEKNSAVLVRITNRILAINALDADGIEDLEEK